MADPAIQPNRRIVGILLRHGRTAANAKKVMRAWADFPLSDEGRIDAQLAANALRLYRPQIIYSSDLMRDMETAQIVAGILAIPHEVDYGLRTADLGVLAGEPLEDTIPYLRRWYEDQGWKPSGGETFGSFFARAWPAITKKLNLARDVRGFCPLAMATHGRDIALAHAIMAGILPARALTPKPGGHALVWLKPDGDYDLEFMGATERILEDA